MQRASRLIIISALIVLSSNIQGVLVTCLSQLTISEEKKDIEPTIKWPGTCSYTISFLGGYEELLMPWADIEIDAYVMQSLSDKDKIVKEFGKEMLLFVTQNAGERLVYLEKIEIYGDEKKNQGLGKQLFLYGLIKIKQRYPKSIYFWIAQPVDGPEKKESLCRFYKNCGGKILKDCDVTALFYIDLAQLDLGVFKPQREMSEYLSVRSRL